MNYNPHNNLKNIFFSVSAFIFMTLAFSQDNIPQEKSEFWKHVRFGGGIGLSTGNNIFSATLAPSAIYDFNNQFSLGVGLNGTYLSRKNFFKSTIFGASIISLFNPINNIQLSGEFEQNHVSQNFDDVSFEDNKYWVPALFIGAGYRTRNATIGIRYDLLYDDIKSVSVNAWAPFVRVYF